MTLESNSDYFQTHPFPQKLKFDFMGKSLDEYMQGISDYAYYTSLFLIYATFVMMQELKTIAESHTIASGISMTTVAMNIVWCFFNFSTHFHYSLWGEFMQYLGLPAFWYFIFAFTFETRLFIFVWRATLS